MSSGITFNSRTEAKEYADQKKAEGYKVALFQQNKVWKVKLLGKEGYPITQPEVEEWVRQESKKLGVTPPKKVVICLTDASNISALVDYPRSTAFLTVERDEEDVRKDIRHELAHYHLHKDKGGRWQEIPPEETLRREMQAAKFAEEKVTPSELFATIYGLVLEKRGSKQEIFKATDKVAKEEKVLQETVENAKVLVNIYLDTYLKDIKTKGRGTK